MRPTGNLQKLRKAGLARLDRLRVYVAPLLIVSGVSVPVFADHRVAFVTIEMDNLWTNLARSLFLSTAFCAQDAQGIRIQLQSIPKAQTIDEALTYAIRQHKGANYKGGSTGPWSWFDEPPWWKPSTLLNSLAAIGASNYQQVSAAMSASPDTFESLRTFRNFYAHRGMGTRLEVVKNLRRMNYPTTYTATQALTSPIFSLGTTRPQPLILDWLDDLRNTITLLV